MMKKSILLGVLLTSSIFAQNNTEAHFTEINHVKETVGNTTFYSECIEISGVNDPNRFGLMTFDSSVRPIGSIFQGQFFQYDADTKIMYVNVTVGDDPWNEAYDLHFTHRAAAYVLVDMVDLKVVDYLSTNATFPLKSSDFADPEMVIDNNVEMKGKESNNMLNSLQYIERTNSWKTQKESCGKVNKEITDIEPKVYFK